MALKSLKTKAWQRQAHLLGAGIKAGFGWAGWQLRALGLPATAREALLREQASNWVRDIGRLKGGVVKAGQILATYGDYCLPAPLAEALHELEADTEPLAWKQIKPLLGEISASLIIEPQPLAAASLSQVHKARNKRDHSQLCLKILYPGIKDTLVNDLAMLGTGLHWWLSDNEQQRFTTWLQNIESILHDELDFQREAQILQRWQARLHTDSRYVVPVTIPTFCSDTVLAMSFEAGVPVYDPAVAGLSQTRRNALAINMLELLLREILQWGEIQTDPHSGNYRIRIDSAGNNDQLVLLDFGSIRPIAESLHRPLCAMLLSVYRRDESALLAAIKTAGLLSTDAPESVCAAFVAMLLALGEPINYRQCTATWNDAVSQGIMDQDGNYCWADANLPKRVGKQALQSAFSQYFVFPGADFLLLSRKLAGVYAFIAEMDARFDGSTVVERLLAELGGDSIVVA